MRKYHRKINFPEAGNKTRNVQQKGICICAGKNTFQQKLTQYSDVWCRVFSQFQRTYKTHDMWRRPPMRIKKILYYNMYRALLFIGGGPDGWRLLPARLVIHIPIILVLRRTSICYKSSRVSMTVVEAELSNTLRPYRQTFSLHIQKLD